MYAFEAGVRPQSPSRMSTNHTNFFIRPITSSTGFQHPVYSIAQHNVSHCQVSQTMTRMDVAQMQMQQELQYVSQNNRNQLSPVAVVPSLSPSPFSQVPHRQNVLILTRKTHGSARFTQITQERQMQTVPSCPVQILEQVMDDSNNPNFIQNPHPPGSSTELQPSFELPPSPGCPDDMATMLEDFNRFQPESIEVPIKAVRKPILTAFKNKSNASEVDATCSKLNVKKSRAKKSPSSSATTATPPTPRKRQPPKNSQKRKKSEADAKVEEEDEQSRTRRKTVELFLEQCPNQNNAAEVILLQPSNQSKELREMDQEMRNLFAEVKRLKDIVTKKTVESKSLWNRIQFLQKEKITAESNANSLCKLLEEKKMEMEAMTLKGNAMEIMVKCPDCERSW